MRFKTKEQLARFAIEYFFANKRIPQVKKEEVAENLRQKACCFVSIYIDGQLRGCMGDYQATEPLYQNIIKNALNACLADYRFPAIQKEDLLKLKTEVSILSPLKEYKPKNTKELLLFLEKEKPGLLIEEDFQKALFLPQVWNKVKSAEEFLSHLCLKAGLPSDSWKNKELKYFIFSVK